MVKSIMAPGPDRTFMCEVWSARTISDLTSAGISPNHTFVRGVKQRIDWSRVSSPGDVLRAIQQRKDEARIRRAGDR